MSRNFADQRSLRVRLAATARRLRADERGLAGVLTALAAPVIIGFGALAIDASMWQVNQRQMQGAADQAAIAGANAFLLAGYTTEDSLATNTIAKDAALAVAKGFGYDACTVQDSTYGRACSSGYGAAAGEVWSPTSTTCKASPTSCLEVTITQPQVHFLSSIVYSGSVVATARAVATLQTGGNGNCVLALNTNPASGTPTPPAPSLQIGGTAALTLNDCSLMNNLGDPDATKDETIVGGTSDLTATGSGQIKLAQTDQFFGSGTISPTPSYSVSPIGDPYGQRTPPSTAGGCTYPSASYNSLAGSLPTLGTPVTVGATTYNTVFTPSSPTTPVVFCGGLNIGTAKVYLNPGIYIMDGGSSASGAFKFTGNGYLYGHNVTIYVTCDSTYYNLKKNPATGNNTGFSSSDCSNYKFYAINISGTGSPTKVDLTPPCGIGPSPSTTANTNSPCSGLNPPKGVDGITIWTDRDAPKCTSTGCNTDTFNGDANLSIDGVIYMPSREVQYAGGPTVTGKCNALVANTIALTGSQATTFSQAGCSSTSGVAYLSPPKLIE